MLVEVSFGEWLKRRRRAAGWTQEQLARQINCSMSALKKFEAEERRPSAQIAERLAEIFDIPPDEQSQFLRYVRGDWNSAPVGHTEEAPWRASTKPPRSNIPATVSSLVGREQEIRDIREYLLGKDIRLVTLMGPPGIGKTRLSIELARQALPDFPDGIFFVALAPLEHASLIATTILQSLDYTAANNQPAIEQLADGIGEKQMLIILDNCEHLVQEVSELVSGLLLACSRLKILTTSREALRIPGEWLYTVPTLDVLESASIDLETASTSPALTLFTERARAVRADFVLDEDNIQPVASICAQLDGLPLAIELIAARIRLMSPQTLLAKLNDQFILYADGMRALPMRQKTLHNAINWSYNLLSVEEQNLFARLSVFSGDFTLESAESVFSRSVTGKSITDLIASLLDKSLLQRTLNERGEPRFGMLVTIQQFAFNKLRQSSEETDVRNWHFDYFLSLAEKADQEIHGANQTEWMDRLEEEQDNFRSALDWCFSNGDSEKLLRLFAALSWTWLLRWSPSEARSWLEKIRTLPHLVAYPRYYARILNIAVRREWLAKNLDEARSLLDESKALWLNLGVDGKGGMAEVLALSGMLSESDIDAATYFTQSFELYQQAGDPWGMAFARFCLGLNAYAKSEYVLALAQLEESMGLFRKLGDRWGMARVSQVLGQLFLKQRLYDKARPYFEQHLIFDEGFKEGTVVALSNLGDLHRCQHEYEQAKQCYEKSISLCREYGIKSDAGYNLYGLGLLALHQDNFLLAKEFFHDYYLANPKFTETVATLRLITGWAAIAAGINKPELAANLSGAAQSISRVIDYQIPPFDQDEFDRHIQIAREQLGEKRFEALAAEGRAMTMEQAIAYALEDQE